MPGLLGRTFILMAIEGRIAEAVALTPKLLKEKPKEPIANLLLSID